MNEPTPDELTANARMRAEITEWNVSQRLRAMGAQRNLTSALQEAHDALAGDSNDAEHDALASVLYALDFDVPTPIDCI